MLSYCEEAADLQGGEYGISSGALAKGLAKHVKEWVEHGVPVE